MLVVLTAAYFPEASIPLLFLLSVLENWTLVACCTVWEKILHIFFQMYTQTTNVTLNTPKCQSCVGVWRVARGPESPKLRRG